MTSIIEAHGLVKRFGDVDALAGLDLVAESGRITALLGPNGAGKTTFVSAVATLIRPDAGELRVAGIRAEQRGDRAHERGLARSVRAEQRGDPPRLGDQVQPGERVDVTEPLDEAVCLDDGGHAETPAVRTSRRSRSP